MPPIKRGDSGQKTKRALGMAKMAKLYEDQAQGRAMKAQTLGGRGLG